MGSSKISAMAVSDGAYGVKVRQGLGFYGAPTTRFPSPLNMARTWSLRTAAYTADAAAKEARALGINVLTAPEGGVLRGESEGESRHFSSDAYLSGKMLSAYVTGYRHSSVIASVNMDEAAVSAFDEKEYREINLMPYEMAVKEGEAKRLVLPDGKVGAERICESRHIVNGIISTEWQYGGVIGAVDEGGVNLTRAMALGASAICSDTPSAEAKRLAEAVHNHKKILEALNDGRLTDDVLAEAMRSGAAVSEAVLDEALATLFTSLEGYEIGLAEAGEKYSSYPFNHPIMFDEQSGAAMALEAALESLVLLKNDGVLPIGAEQKVALVGEYAFLPLGSCSDEVDFVPLDNEITARMLGKSGLRTIGCAKGFAYEANALQSAAMLGDAKQLCAEADVVAVYLGNLAEGGTALPENQLEFLRELRRSTAAKIVGIYFGSCLKDNGFGELCDALVLAGDAGQGGAMAVLKVLSGAYCPSGKLTSPIFGNGGIVYPFGYGLSYTEFEYSSLGISGEGVSLTLTNTGYIAGEETVQLYIDKPESSVSRGGLRGFVKVRLDAKESRRIRIPFDSKAFRYYNTETHSWETEGGVYNIKIGASSTDIRLEGQITVPSSGAAVPEKKADTETVAPTEESEVLVSNELPVGKMAALISAVAGIGLLAMMYFAFLREEIFFALDVHRSDELTWDIIFIVIMACGLAAAVTGMINIALKAKKSTPVLEAASGKTHPMLMFDQTEYRADTLYPEDWKKIIFPDGTAVPEEEENFEELDTEQEAAAEELILPSECALVRRTAFETLETDISALCDDLCKYVAEKRIIADREELLELFAAVASSGRIAIRCTDTFGAARTLESLGEFFGMNVIALPELDGHPDIGVALNTASEERDSICMAFADCHDAAEAFAGFGDISALPENLRVVALISDTSCVGTGNATLIRLHADAENMLDIQAAMAADYDNKFIYAYTLNTRTLNDTVQRSREVSYLSEKYWRKIDRLVEHIGASVHFAISNKTANVMEKFLTVCVAGGMEQTAALDCVVSALVLSALPEGLDTKSDEPLSEFMDAVFGADKDDRSREIVKLKGIR